MGLNKRLYEEKQNRKVKYNRMPDNRWPLDVTIEGDTGMTQQWERQQDTKAVALFNKKIRAWGAKVDSALRTSIGIHIEEDKELSKSLKQNYRHFGKSPPHSSYAQRRVGRRVGSLRGEEITSIGFRFREEGIFVHLGVGKGYNMEGGTRVITKKTDREWRRRPKPWFNSIIEKHIPELVEIVKEYCGSLIINTTRIYINRNG